MFLETQLFALLNKFDFILIQSQSDIHFVLSIHYGLTVTTFQRATLSSVSLVKIWHLSFKTWYCLILGFPIEKKNIK